MQFHELKPIHQKKKSKRVGRGGKKGTYCGRGMKGQSARAGHRFQPLVRSLIKKYPKLRGYSFKPLNKDLTVINLETLEKKFQPGDKINPAVLLEKRLIRRIKGRLPRVKILGQGELTKALTIENCQVSQSAKDKIEKAHGQIQ